MIVITFLDRFTLEAKRDTRHQRVRADPRCEVYLHFWNVRPRSSQTGNVTASQEPYFCQVFVASYFWVRFAMPVDTAERTSTSLTATRLVDTVGFPCVFMLPAAAATDFQATAA